MYALLIGVEYILFNTRVSLKEKKTNATPKMAAPIKENPISPGSKKSMYV
jgi:hypothetical protein